MSNISKGVCAAVCLFILLTGAAALAQGTAGDVVLDGSEPGMTTYGVFLKPKTTHPNAGVRINGATQSQSFVVFDSANTSLLAVRGNGNVTIGPGRSGIHARLEVVATDATTNTNAATTSYGGILLTNNVDSSMVLRTLGAGVSQIATDGSVRALSLASGAFREAIRIDPSQNVGIGTSTPTSKLHVEGAMQVGKHLKLPVWTNVSNNITSGFLKLVTPIVQNESNMFLIHIKGYHFYTLGDPVDIRCTGYAYATTGALTRTNCDTNGTSLPVAIGVETRADTNQQVVVIRIGTASTQWYYGHFTAEYSGWKLKDPDDFLWVVATSDPGTGYSNNTNNVMIDDVNGTLTLGATGTGPNRLTVNGSATVTGNITATGTITGVINATYQDIAEWVPTTVDVAPGTVVVLNTDRINEVMPSHRAYDTSVAGVVSAQPGMILGQAGDAKAKIATYGRVKVRVDANRAPIRVGDLLVTSDKPGTAMKSIAVEMQGIPMHRPGTVLGKALEPLATGEGEILVLLSLQ